MKTSDRGSSHSRLDWTLAAFAIILLIPISHLGNRLPLIVQDIDVVMILVLLVSLPVIAWWRLARNSGSARWRLMISALGCLSLSVSLVIPISIFLVPFAWIRWNLLSAWLGFSVIFSPGFYRCQDRALSTGSRRLRHE
jgi:hypothetical protein